MPDFAWPTAEDRSLIGKRISRLDSPDKVSGRAKYNYDYHPSGPMLFGKVLRSPHAKAKILSVDTTAAQKMPGVEAVEVIQKIGGTVQWAGDEIAAVAAVDEGTAEEAIRAINVKYEPLAYLVSDAEPPAGSAEAPGPMSEDDVWDAIDNQMPERQFLEYLKEHGVSFHPEEDLLKQFKGDGASDAILDALRKAEYHEPSGSGTRSPYQKAAATTQGDPDKAFAEASVVSEGLYGTSVITHCCLESHGSTAEWPDEDHLFVHISTQNVSGVPSQMAEPLGVPAANIRVHQDHIGGGFGSKFSADRWDITAAKLSRKAGGRPVRIMLERDAELVNVGGCRQRVAQRDQTGGVQVQQPLIERLHAVVLALGDDLLDRRPSPTSFQFQISAKSTPQFATTSARHGRGVLLIIRKPQ